MKFSQETDLPISQRTPLHVDKQDLSGKTIVITGGNSGIGLECARKLATMNPSKIILASRTMKTAEKAVQDIKTEIGFNNVEAWPLDQASFESVQAFAKKYNESGLDLDILLANAGMLPFTRRNLEMTSDGHEEVLETNHLSASLLAMSLLPSIRRTAAKSTSANRPRIVIVASDVHYWATLRSAQQDGNIIKAMDTPEYYADARERYMDTKLLNVFWTQEFAKKMTQSTVEEDHKIVVSSCNPGLVLSTNSDFMRENLPPALLEVARNMEEGCKTHLFACIDPSAGTPGEANFYHNCQPTETADITLGAEGDILRKRVWKDTIEVLPTLDQSISQPLGL
ncbi:hypothetical protein INT44_009369 [Umbelopsis vinacea]|uniref:Uncharacterized protein n=1 Tax=Umbelopsis vinacea TaxID=44442 RepID=A0A8H7Q3H2_9FUNG|nr:hypothetical protein INT44_009369 [Umbelopsis vinacea]